MQLLLNTACPTDIVQAGVNEWRRADYHLKKHREKTGRLSAQMYVLDEK
ncbi:MAG: hypothetical protein IPH58_17325 [Sphingobacteriales bacterium]|nr:hypothetical protein [Sphingobacteriales bacterium]